MWSGTNLFGQILFGAVGLAAFVYGRKAGEIRPILIGVAIMAYPYFVSETWVLYTIGTLLTGSLFVFRE